MFYNRCRPCLGYTGSPSPMSALTRGTPFKGEYWTNNPPYLENGERCEVSYFYSHTEGRIRAFIGTEIGGLE